MSERFLLFLCLGQEKNALNPGTRVSLVKVLAKTLKISKPVPSKSLMISTLSTKSLKHLCPSCGTPTTCSKIPESFLEKVQQKVFFFFNFGTMGAKVFQESFAPPKTCCAPVQLLFAPHSSSFLCFWGFPGLLPYKETPCFLSVRPFFPWNFRGSAERKRKKYKKKPCLSVGLLCLLQKEERARKRRSGQCSSP